jgi:hypothetical protein
MRSALSVTIQGRGVSIIFLVVKSSYFVVGVAEEKGEIQENFISRFPKLPRMRREEAGSTTITWGSAPVDNSRSLGSFLAECVDVGHNIMTALSFLVRISESALLLLEESGRRCWYIW